MISNRNPRFQKTQKHEILMAAKNSREQKKKLSKKVIYSDAAGFCPDVETERRENLVFYALPTRRCLCLGRRVTRLGEIFDYWAIFLLFSTGISDTVPCRCLLQTGCNTTTITRHHCHHFPTLSQEHLSLSLKSNLAQDSLFT
jgi:hypothetical protein